MEEKKQQSGNRWIKVTDRLPGWKLRVKWRDGKDHYNATKGEISLFEMDKPNLEGWEWYDESNESPAEQPTQYPGSFYQPLFDLMSQEHGVILTESEMSEIITVVRKMEQPVREVERKNYESLFKAQAEYIRLLSDELN